MFSRRDVFEIEVNAERELLTSYGLALTDLIGQGMEARVYALDEKRVLKVCAGPGQRANLETLQDFYRRLDGRNLPYELPEIYAVDPHGDLLAVIERRINGIPMAEFPASDMGHFEDIYLATVITLARAKIHQPFGRFLLLETPASVITPADDWHAFLRSLILRKLSALLPALRRDVPLIESRANALLAAFSSPYEGPVGVIHGDFCRGNVLMRDRSSVAGVIDFGTFTMIGDPLFDVATACGFFDMYGDDHTEIRMHLLTRAAEMLNIDRGQATLTAYLLTGALLSCDLYARDGAPLRNDGHYRWACEILRQGE
ncbi:MAG TPA: aminoglycoside phosphotransferase family protein [Candidatus Baltobacteraceae bacterium]|jgi:hypothetical protein|nr:aminoglycoside phosphotransferase family protein [Candidatus Baltobacteraceae bacterium]